MQDTDFSRINTATVVGIYVRYDFSRINTTTVVGIYVID